MPTENMNEEWQRQQDEAERLDDIEEKKKAKWRKIKWLIKGHLIWHTGRYWHKFQIEKMHEHCIGSDLKSRRIVSAYEYWERYSCTNGC